MDNCWPKFYYKIDFIKKNVMVPKTVALYLIWVQFLYTVLVKKILYTLIILILIYLLALETKTPFNFFLENIFIAMNNFPKFSLFIIYKWQTNEFTPPNVSWKVESIRKEPSAMLK